MQSDIFTQDSEAAYARMVPNDVWEAEALAWIETIIGGREQKARAEDQGKGMASSGTAVPAPSTTGSREPSTGE